MHFIQTSYFPEHANNNEIVCAKILWEKASVSCYGNGQFFFKTLSKNLTTYPIVDSNQGWNSQKG